MMKKLTPAEPDKTSTKEIKHDKKRICPSRTNVAKYVKQYHSTWKRKKMKDENDWNLRFLRALKNGLAINEVYWKVWLLNLERNPEAIEGKKMAIKQNQNKTQKVKPHRRGGLHEERAHRGFSDPAYHLNSPKTLASFEAKIQQKTLRWATIICVYGANKDFPIRRN